MLYAPLSVLDFSFEPLDEPNQKLMTLVMDDVRLPTMINKTGVILSDVSTSPTTIM